MVPTQLRFGDGPVEAVILPEVGARLHRLRAFGHDLLRTPDDPATHLRDPFFWGSYVMAPWCNRIEASPVRVGTRRIELGSNVADGSAIHGQVYVRAWEPMGDGTLRIRAGDDGWPWSYDVALRVTVENALLRLELTLTNRSDEPMPAGLGIHPWFRRPVRVAIRGGAVYESNAASPAYPVPVHGLFDLRDPREIESGLDATWTDLATPPVVLQWPVLGVRATMRTRPPVTYVVAASPVDPDAVAVEPQTHAPQGLRRLLHGEPGGLTMLEGGEALDLGVELAFEHLDNA